MPPVELVGYLAPATLVAGAILTSLNAGARITGFGFIAISAAQLGYGVIGLTEGSRVTVVTAGLLLLINAIGASRWLRHVAPADAAAERARRNSNKSPLCENIVSARLTLGSAVFEPDGQHVGQIEDLILSDNSDRIAYYVIHPSGARAGHDFVGVEPAAIRASSSHITLIKPMEQGTPLPARAWPAKLAPENSGSG